ncbi:cobyrinate a,c-diamide synthase [Singulisphaera acidiphila]|uniref:Cobyrinate a,c-diamide synthase n=1 Tax=Singulisphaera acidiphila (strain ATCC BAA-1392 / DSM 18658 / VKM B-2454 / MOB10) TaxID=886293 RepID=L0DMN8_SINAD|nr:cobyrinate a,c-diamide synthase [Singulisphaera acidiphila]AGA30090.1 cobyrinic acid a,c-diamide synthase [Singulisphaera acidiphila DSM 18658]
MTTPAVIVAGTHSGSGKTTVTLAILAALTRRGVRVQGFKVGPDFIDPGHQTRITGRPSRNLDTWLLDPPALAETFRNGTVGADLAVIEGVMGLFDGRGGLDESGSTADLARQLGLPVVLVVDARGLARSIVPLVLGFARFDESVRVEGIVANNVGSHRHYAEYLAPGLRAEASDLSLLGYLARNELLSIPSRHLGLWTAEELALDSSLANALADVAESTLDLDRLVELARIPNLVPPSESAAPGPRARPTVRVGLARDHAFCFYYEDNLDQLRAAGAEIVPFSPLNDPELPPGIDLVYLGGGYPEIHAARLAANDAMRASIRSFHAQGGTILAECGGMMACTQFLRDLEGKDHALWGLIPARAVMQSKLAALGYVSVIAERDTVLGREGTTVRGHEFHYSQLEPLASLRYATSLNRPGRESKPDGIQIGGLLAGYAHLHFGSNGRVAATLLESSRTSWKNST